MNGTFNIVFMRRPENIVQTWPGSFGKNLLDEQTVCHTREVALATSNGCVELPEIKPSALPGNLTEL
jgi:hypothetical protein